MTIILIHEKSCCEHLIQYGGCFMPFRIRDRVFALKGKSPNAETQQKEVEKRGTNNVFSW